MVTWRTLFNSLTVNFKEKDVLDVNFKEESDNFSNQYSANLKHKQSCKFILFWRENGTPSMNWGKGLKLLKLQNMKSFKAALVDFNPTQRTVIITVTNNQRISNEHKNPESSGSNLRKTIIQINMYAFVVTFVNI